MFSWLFYFWPMEHFMLKINNKLSLSPHLLCWESFAKTLQFLVEFIFSLFKSIDSILISFQQILMQLFMWKLKTNFWKLVRWVDKISEINIRVVLFDCNRIPIFVVIHVEFEHSLYHRNWGETCYIFIYLREPWWHNSIDYHIFLFEALVFTPLDNRFKFLNFS